MPNTYLVKQIKDIVNDSVRDALGSNVTLSQLDSTDVVSLGKAISQYEAYEGFFKSLANRIVRTIYFIRTYEGSKRSILRDEHEYGAFIQKVYYEMPEAVDNPTWNIPDANGLYTQANPYDISTTIGVSSLVFGGKGTWSIEIIRPIEQIKTAFLETAAMMNFIDGLYLSVENAFRMEEDRLVALAANTAMALAIKSGHARNLLSEYNNDHPTAPVSAGAALKNADFLKYASMEINRTMKNMGKMSTVFNISNYPTFTSRDKLVVEMLAEFASASEMYLQADTFHNELVKLPNYEEIPFWQGSGSSFDFNDCSTIKVKHESLSDGSGDDDVVEQTGIICFLHDIENVAAYFGNRRSWELVNQRSEVVIHGEKAEKGYAVDSHANSVVFYIADSIDNVEVSTQAWTAAQLLGGKSASDLQENIVINNSTKAISGTLKYVTGYTQFSGIEAEQSGNYLAVQIEPESDADVYIRLSEMKPWKQMDSDHILIARIHSTTSQKLYIKTVNDGREEFVTYDLSGLTLTPAS